MSKLLTDLMAAERRRRQLAVGKTAGEGSVKPAGPAAANRARIAAEAVAVFENQAEAERLAEEAALARAAVEGSAADQAEKQARAERAAEAAALSRAAAEQKAMQEARRRTEKESEAAHATKARLEAERKAGAAQALRVAADAEAAAASASHQGTTTALAAGRPAASGPERAADMAAAQSGPQPWRHQLAATAVALMTGLGAGFWLGKPPAVYVRPWAEDPGVLRLRLDDKLMNPPLQEPRRDRAP